MCNQCIDCFFYLEQCPDDDSEELCILDPDKPVEINYSDPACQLDFFDDFYSFKEILVDLIQNDIDGVTSFRMNMYRSFLANLENVEEQWATFEEWLNHFMRKQISMHTGQHIPPSWH